MNIFDCLQDEKSSKQIAHENMNCILLTLNDKQPSNNGTTKFDYKKKHVFF